jgi:hypothetical protein
MDRRGQERTGQERRSPSSKACKKSHTRLSAEEFFRKDVVPRGSFGVGRYVPMPTRR